jgi:hypothetical protein
MANEEKYMETIAYTNGEMQATIASMFGMENDNLCRWAIVIIADVPGEDPDIHDIRVASNCEDSDILTLLDLARTAL